jgi:REDY-like protein HapK
LFFAYHPRFGGISAKNAAYSGVAEKEPIMKQIIILYNLRPDVTTERFEDWVRTVDQPNMRGLSRVSRFRTFRTEGHLMGEGKPSVQYVEVFDISDLDAFTGQDMASDVVQMVLGAFMGMVENPEMIIASEV